jgi:flavin-dependent thymidylate synthase
MRYCNYGKRGLQVICPPSIGIEPGEYTLDSGPELHDLRLKTIYLESRQRRWVANIELSYNEYLMELDEGIPPEDARFILPVATKTELTVTYNLRMWRHLFRERAFNKHAQWEIRNTFNEIYTDLVQRLPDVFGDLET